jgi:hypothetical protein
MREINVTHLTSRDAADRLKEVEEAMTQARAWQTKLREQVAKCEQEIKELPSTYQRNRDEMMTFEEFTEALAELRHGGVTSVTGQSRRIPFRMLGRPGLGEVKRDLRVLTNEAKALRKHMERWPDPTTTHPYTYTGQPGLAYVEGRALEEGDVVQLTQTQASGWADRFKPASAADKRAAKESGQSARA